MQVLFKQVLVVAALALVSAGAQANPTLAKKKGCANCHGGVTGVKVRPAVAGMPKAPSFYELYARFGGQTDGEAKMAAALQANPKHPKVALNDTERTALMKFYASTEPVDTAGKRLAQANEAAPAK
jgi:cytochrome c551/c552